MQAASLARYASNVAQWDFDCVVQDGNADKVDAVEQPAGSCPASPPGSPLATAFAFQPPSGDWPASQPGSPPPSPFSCDPPAGSRPTSQPGSPLPSSIITRRQGRFTVFEGFDPAPPPEEPHGSDPGPSQTGLARQRSASSPAALGRADASEHNTLECGTSQELGPSPRLSSDLPDGRGAGEDQRVQPACAPSVQSKGRFRIVQTMAEDQ